MSYQKKIDAAPVWMHRGLCAYCRYAFECDFPRDPDIPVFHCEEFEGHNNPQITVSIKNRTDDQAHYNSSDINMESQKKPLGLCSNCELREKCTFPKHEGGVWHCEEYE